MTIDMIMVILMESTMKTMKASEFKAKCLQLMDDVAKTGKVVVITKYGKPIVQLVPFKKKPKTLFGAVKGAVVIKGNVISPIDVSWDASG